MNLTNLPMSLDEMPLPSYLPPVILTVFTRSDLLKEVLSIFWFLCGNEVYTDSFFHKIVLKVLPSKHLTLHKQKLSHKVDKIRFKGFNPTDSICVA